MAPLAMAGGCDWLTGPAPVYLGLVTDVLAPDSVAAGELFTVTVVTSGPNTCWGKERTDVESGRRSATITPYDYNQRDEDPHAVSGQAPPRIEHSVALEFDQTGTGTITIRGRDGTGREISIAVE